MTAPPPRGWQPSAFVDHVREVLSELIRRQDRRLSLRAFVDLPKGWTSADSDVRPRAAWRPPQGLRAEALGVAATCPLQEVRWQDDAPHPDDLTTLRGWLAQFPLLADAVLACAFPENRPDGVVVPLHLWLPRLWLAEQSDGRTEATLLLLGEDAADPLLTELDRLFASVMPRTVDAVEFVAVDPPHDQHAQQIGQLVDAMRSGAAHKVVWSRVLPLETSGARAAVARQMAQNRPEAWLVDVELPTGANILCATPELLVRCTGGTVTTMALAGTGSVAQLSAEDPRLGDEHGRVRDFVQARLTALGVQELTLQADLTQAGPLTHRRTHITGQRTQDVDALTAALTLHPTPALLGLPRANALALVETVEPPRGLYAGCLGRLACDGSGDGEVVALLRGVAQEHGGWHARAGAGLVPDSIPKDESAEIAQKLAAIVQSVNGGAA